MHHLRQAAELLADYVIVAPTEWNFHPGGAYTQVMPGIKERGVEHLLQLVNIAALSLDPRVAYEVGVRHA
jgi:hypothetical protein